MRSYIEFKGFEHLYLEDSYVLEIVEGTDSVHFRLDVVLLPGHELYGPPKEGERYCYRRACLAFEGVLSKEWVARHSSRYRDASGEVDYGNIDCLTETAGAYRLSGDWGTIEIRSCLPTVTFDEDTHAGAAPLE